LRYRSVSDSHRDSDLVKAWGPVSGHFSSTAARAGVGRSGKWLGRNRGVSSQRRRTAQRGSGAAARRRRRRRTAAAASPAAPAPPALASPAPPAAPPLTAVRDARGGVAAASSATSLCRMYHRELRGGTERVLPSGRGRQAELLASSRHRIPPTIYFEEQKCLGCFAMQHLIAASKIYSPTRDTSALEIYFYPWVSIL
jgi:nucleoid-associated protein YgaU